VANVRRKKGFQPHAVKHWHFVRLNAWQIFSVRRRRKEKEKKGRKKKEEREKKG
jgi:hypothetical protein